MTTIISTTYDDQYLFYLPITTWAWNKIGINVECFIPNHENHAGANPDKLTMVVHHMVGMKYNLHKFKCPDYKEATYAQVSRLFGCCLDLPDNEVLITGDIDMCPFGDTFLTANDGNIYVFGNDLVPNEQLPMCYLIAPVATWRSIMWAPPGFGYQYYLDELLGPIECQHFRANQWSFDQGLAYKNFIASGMPINYHSRAKPGTQFATRRADRDGWPHTISPDIIDAHLKRPGYLPENFDSILKLFTDTYPNEDFSWMLNYQKDYLKLIL